MKPNKPTKKNEFWIELKPMAERLVKRVAQYQMSYDEYISERYSILKSEAAVKSNPVAVEKCISYFDGAIQMLTDSGLLVTEKFDDGDERLIWKDSGKIWI